MAHLRQQSLFVPHANESALGVHVNSDNAHGAVGFVQRVLMPLEYLLQHTPDANNAPCQNRHLQRQRTRIPYEWHDIAADAHPDWMCECR